MFFVDIWAHFCWALWGVAWLGHGVCVWELCQIPPNSFLKYWDSFPLHELSSQIPSSLPPRHTVRLHFPVSLAVKWHTMPSPHQWPCVPLPCSTDSAPSPHSPLPFLSLEPTVTHVNHADDGNAQWEGREACWLGSDFLKTSPEYSCPHQPSSCERGGLPCSSSQLFWGLLVIRVRPFILNNPGNGACGGVPISDVVLRVSQWIRVINHVTETFYTLYLSCNEESESKCVLLAAHVTSPL